jgi:hypothetical protein
VLNKLYASKKFKQRKNKPSEIEAHKHVFTNHGIVKLNNKVFTLSYPSYPNVPHSTKYLSFESASFNSLSHKSHYKRTQSNDCLTVCHLDRNLSYNPHHPKTSKLQPPRSKSAYLPTTYKLKNEHSSRTTTNMTSRTKFNRRLRHEDPHELRGWDTNVFESSDVDTQDHRVYTIL